MIDSRVVRELAKEAGAKLFFHKDIGKDGKVVICDDNESGNGTYFVDKFRFYY